MRNLWQGLFKCERSCEVLRTSLRARPYFNLKAAFCYLDRNGAGQVSLDDIREFLSNNGFFATERELLGIMTKCDKNGDGRINFNEFIDEFQPKLN
jgi:Ca2+-binding EF-hand superfamily protein